MALLSCPECSGKISDKAIMCPHCGYPIQENSTTIKVSKKRNPKRRPNGSGTIVKISNKRKNPFQVRVNTRLDDRGYPVFEILGNYPDSVTASIALAEYNKDPYDPKNRKMLFSEVFSGWYQWKYKEPYDVKKRKSNSQYCVLAAYNKCSSLHNVSFSDIRPLDLQKILDNAEISHAMLEHIKSLFNQIYKYAMQFEITQKNYASYVSINKEDDTVSGVPFTPEEIKLLWQNKELPWVDTVLIYCYSGWRINELARMPLGDIDLINRTFTGGLKTRFSRNRTVPIHSGIYEMVSQRYNTCFSSLIYHDDTKDITELRYRNHFNQALISCGIKSIHTPHDCRHTFNVLLDKAGVDRVTRYKLMGHAGKDINENVYTHKDLDQLRKSIEMIKI